MNWNKIYVVNSVDTKLNLFNFLQHLKIASNPSFSIPVFPINNSYRFLRKYPIAVPPLDLIGHFAMCRTLISYELLPMTSTAFGVKLL